MIALGKWRFPAPEAPRVKVTCEFSAEAKVDKKEAKGKDDAHTTYGGKKPRDVKVSLAWPEHEAWRGGDGQTPEDVYVRRALVELSPTGPKAGEPWEITHADAELFGVGSVLFEKMSLKRGDTNTLTCELSGASWAKGSGDAAGAGKSKSADKSNPWDADGKVRNFGGNKTEVGGFDYEPDGPEVKP
jgi:hypothetical protein